MSVTLDPYDFGTRAVGSTTSAFLTYTNSGGVAAQHTSSTLSGDFQFSGGVFPGTGGTCAASLPAGGSCTVEINYSPTAAAPDSSNLEYNYNDGVTGQSEISQLEGYGASPANLAISEADPYVYPMRGVGFSVNHTFTVTNMGGFSATALNEVGLAGPFQFVGGTYPGTGGTCGATLTSGASCTIEVQFAPVNPGFYSESIEITYSNGVGPSNVTRSVQGDSFEPFMSMALGAQHSCAKRPNGIGLCWGGNTSGQLGNGTTTQSLTPVTVTGAMNWAQLSSRESHSCGVDVLNTGYCWGMNTNGQVGDNTTTTRLNPVALGGGGVWQKIATGASHTCGLKTNGSIACWGLNTKGQLGDGTTTQRLTPVTVMGGGTFIDVAVGSFSTCAVTTANAVYCWGRGDSGQIGNGAMTMTNPAPTLASILIGAYSKVAVGMNFACAQQLSGGLVMCWGNGIKGQLGNGSTTSAIANSVVVSGSNFEKIEAGPESVCAYSSFTNEVRCWGDNAFGQLGDGTTTNRSSPVLVGSQYLDVFVGKFHACGLTTSGGTRCWGINTHGQLGDGTTTNRPAPVAINP